MINTVSTILSVLGVGSILLYFIKRYFTKRDKEAEEDRKLRDEFYRKVDIGLDTLRLLSYHRLSQEIERLLTQDYATPSERRVLEELANNYHAHGWNGDMTERIEKVRHLPTDRPHK